MSLICADFLKIVSSSRGLSTLDGESDSLLLLGDSDSMSLGGDAGYVCALGCELLRDDTLSISVCLVSIVISVTSEMRSIYSN